MQGFEEPGLFSFVVVQQRSFTLRTPFEGGKCRIPVLEVFVFLTQGVVEKTQLFRLPLVIVPGRKRVIQEFGYDLLDSVNMLLIPGPSRTGQQPVRLAVLWMALEQTLQVRDCASCLSIEYQAIGMIDGIPGISRIVSVGHFMPVARLRLVAGAQKHGTDEILYHGIIRTAGARLVHSLLSADYLPGLHEQPSKLCPRCTMTRINFRHRAKRIDRRFPLPTGQCHQADQEVTLREPGLLL